MGFEIFSRSPRQSRIVAEVAEGGVTKITKECANGPRVVIVVYHQLGWSIPAHPTAPALGADHRLVFTGPKAILLVPVVGSHVRTTLLIPTPLTLAGPNKHSLAIGLIPRRVIARLAHTLGPVGPFGMAR
jgi:hypothetical protein